MVGSGFGAGGFAGGDQADALIGLPVAMADHQQAHVLAHAQDDEALLGRGMIRVGNDQGFQILKDGGGFLKTQAMLPLVCPVLGLVPLKRHRIHNYIVIMDAFVVKL